MPRMLPVTLTITLYRRILVPAIVSQHLPMFSTAVLASALLTPIRDNVPVTVPFPGVTATLMSLGAVGVTLPIRMPAVAVAIPRTLAIIGIPIGVELERNDWERNERRVIR